MAKYGFLGSSFDPITNGHLTSAQEILDRLGFDKIFLMPSSSKRTDKKINATDRQRLDMIELAIKGNDRFDLETYELGVSAWQVYTYETMRVLKEKEEFKEHDLYFLMGADLLQDIAIGDNWKHREELLSENKFVVIRRSGLDMHEIVASSKLLRKYEHHFTFIYRGVDNNISSSYIREEFEIGHNPRYYMPQAIYEYIRDNNLYQ
ncbi:nicotinate (nicotinamide) nucleotide adenylyltransferase [Radiobacillus kanasensis]|uniref:nicotinate (nicotinamide) nucleotide adenylyltransferase n=1 Tax=Radiobacillus kanasensis TaxID=2844358 RepID=UPI001E39385C|nr:nicotinate (nicotinamide) nucleotide adenylyltransferase [Radiobacillus kanasensis]UFT99674.1 nicotinate (nicotinamide) nucleotide adenylyltransferase [Radiobacillus kanasensis]